MNELLEQLDFFYVYDEGLISFLNKKGFRYITKAKHYKTDKLFAVFLVTDQLKEYVDKWNELHN